MNNKKNDDNDDKSELPFLMVVIWFLIGVGTVFIAWQAFFVWFWFGIIFRVILDQSKK